MGLPGEVPQDAGKSSQASGQSLIVGALKADDNAEQVRWPSFSSRKLYVTKEDVRSRGAAGENCDERPRCGDGVQQAAEDCDDGNIEAGDGCSPLHHRRVIVSHCAP